MRELLTGLAIILIVVLTTILVAPYFVDWNGQRSFLESRLSRVLGQPVTIGGNIDLKLLPTPYLVLDQVVVGGDDGPLRIGIHHLDLELAATPLMHGEFDITEARLKEPTVRMTLKDDHSLPVLQKAPAFAADVRFDRIHVSDGTLAVTDPSSGHTFRFDHLDFDADAGSFAGPFKITGKEGPDGARTNFRLATATPQNGRTRARLVVDENARHAAYDFDGTLNLQKIGDVLRQSFEGTASVTGHLKPNGESSIAWKLSGPFKADPSSAVLEGGELRLGGEENAVTLAANATGEFTQSPRMALDLSAKQLDFDRLSGAPVDMTKPPPPKLPDLLTIRRLLAALRPPIRTALDLSIETATYGNETLSDIQAHLGLGESTQPLKVSADGPGGSHVSIEGRLTLDASPVFAGTAAFAADNLPHAFEWLAGVATSFPWRGGDLLFQTVKANGQISILSDKAGNDVIDSDSLTLTLDRSVLKGKAHIALGDETHASKIAADLTADPLDLDGLPSLDSLRGGTGAFDIDLLLDAKAMKVERLGDAALETGRIKLAFARTGPRIELKRFRAEHLDGATVDASGMFDARRATLSVTLDASRLERFAGLARRIAPGPVTDALAARAATLAPAKISINADLSAPGGTANKGSPLSPSRLAVSGTLGATKIDVSTKSDESKSKVTAIVATLEAPEGTALLSQLGLKTLPIANVGESRVMLSAAQRKADRLDTVLVAAFGATKLDASGVFDLRAATIDGTGRVHLQSTDITPLLQSLAIAFPDLTAHVPVDLAGVLTLGKDGPSANDLKGRVAGVGVAGRLVWHPDAGDKPALTGALDLDHLALANLVGLALGPEQVAAQGTAWSKETFATGLVDPPRSAVSLKIKSLEIWPQTTARNASLDLVISPNVLRLDNLKADLNGGRIDGNAKMRRDENQATIEGKIGLDRVAIDLPTLDTHLSASLDVAGSGTSPSGVISSLAGSGEATTAALEIHGADPKALPKIFDEIENDVLAVDEESVVQAFTDAAKAPLRAETRRFGLSLAAGVLHFDPKGADSSAQQPVTSKIDATLDLVRTKLDTHVNETLNALPKNWSGPPPSIVVTTENALGKPSHSFDVSSFLNAVAARALARETARVEAFEFDLHERAFFNTRLQSERRRESERLLAEENARKAEEDRKARIEAARQDRLRKEQDDKDRAGREESDRAAGERAAQERGGARGDGVPKGDQGPEPNRGSASSRPPQPPRRPADPSGVPRPPRRPAPALSDPSALGRD